MRNTLPAISWCSIHLSMRGEGRAGSGCAIKRPTRCEWLAARVSGRARQASNVCLPFHNLGRWSSGRAIAGAPACLPLMAVPVRGSSFVLGAFFGTVLNKHCFEEGHRPPEAANGRGSVKSSRRKYYPAGWGRGGWAGWRFLRKGLTGSRVFARFHYCEAAFVSWGLAPTRRACKSGEVQQGGSHSRPGVTSNGARRLVVVVRFPSGAVRGSGGV